MSQDSSFVGSEFDGYMMGGSPAPAVAHPTASPGALPPLRSAGRPGAAPPTPQRASTSKRKIQFIAMGCVLAAVAIVAVVFMRPKSGPASPDIAAIVAAAHSTEAAKAALVTHSMPTAPATAPATTPAAVIAPVAQAQPSTSTESPAQLATVAAAPQASNDVVAAPSADRVAAQASVPAASPPAPVVADDDATIRKLRADLSAERAARLRAERRASVGSATVAAILSDGVVVRDAKGVERVIAVGEKVQL